jgi:hypothetical protein
MLDKLFQQYLQLMGDEKELHIFRGLLMNPTRVPKEDGTYYFTFDLKCLKSIGDDTEYGQTYNMFHMVIAGEKAQEVTAEELQAYKMNEVLISANMRSSVRQKDGHKYNNTSYYVTEIELSREVSNKQTAPLRKVENL